MAVVRFENQKLEWNKGESLLECLERGGADIPSSCRSGACHSCLVKVKEGPVPEIAQVGLKPAWKEQGLCLTCVSTDPVDLTVARSDSSVQVNARVAGKDRLGTDVVRLRLVPEAQFAIRAGQFVNLTRKDGLTRSYSVASVEADGYVELHVRVVPKGRMSEWVANTLQVGETLSLRGPGGDCFYLDDRLDQPLLLIGTGTGLAPLVGIARDALARGHRGSIALVHGGRGPADLYLDLELRQLAKRHKNFRYLPTLSQAEPMPGAFQGRVDKVVAEQFPSLAGFQVFLCGSPAMVKDSRALAYRLGASLDDIHADAFIPAPPPKTAEVPKKKFEVKTGTPKMQKVRFAVQAAIFAGFISQAVLFYLARIRPMGNLLPFMAYDSLGHLVVSSTLVLWATLFVAVFIFGRFACGWLCPIGFVQDAGEKLLKWLKVPLRRPLRQPNLVRAVMACIILGHFVVMPVLAAPVRVWQFDWLFREPWLLGFPFRAGLFALDLLLLFVVLGLVLPYFFGPRPYCKLVCETGYLFDLTSRVSFGRVRRNEGFERDTCLSCQRCTNICPQGINVFEEVHLFDRVVSSGCIACMQCVNTCPNETIVYSLKKKAADTGRVVGYLAALQTRLEDLPRYILSGAGVIAGGVLGFVILPPSYFHTYAMFASLGGLGGFLAWRGLAVALGPTMAAWFPAAAASQVERERAAKLVPLSAEERLKPERAAQRRLWTFAVTALAIIAAAATGGYQMSRHVPPRIGAIEEIPTALSTAAAREKAGTFFLGVATETSPERTQRTWAGLRDALLDTYSSDPRLWRADRYGELALALEHEKIDAAFLPGASAYTLLKRSHLAVHVIAQTRFRGATTYTGLLMARPGLTADAESLTGARVAFVEPDSLSGYIAPEQWMVRKGLHLADLGEVMFAGNHSQALQLLTSGRADIAATFDSALAEYKTRDPSLQLVELARFENLPNAMLVTRASMSDEECENLVRALQRVWEEPELEHARVALEEGAAMDGLVPATVDALRGVGDWFDP